MAETTRTILLVEDEAVIAMMEKAILTRQGYNVLTAASGEEAVRAALEIPTINLILMDIDLGPGMDGTTAAQRILGYREVPVIFLSSHTEPEIVSRTERITSYGYIVKNSGDTVLAASIKMAFRLFEARKKERRTAGKLAHSQDLMRYVIEHDRSAIAIHDRNLNYLYVSDAYLRSFGATQEKVVGRHHYEVFPDLPQKWRDVHQRALTGEILTGDNDLFRREDGTELWTRWECRPWYDDDGTIGGIIVNTQVINDERETSQARDKLKAYEQKWHAVANHAPYPILELSGCGRILTVNPAGITLLGLPPTGPSALTLTDVCVGDCRRKAMALLKRVMAGEPGMETLQLGLNGAAAQSFAVTIHRVDDGSAVAMGLTVAPLGAS